MVGFSESTLEVLGDSLKSFWSNSEGDCSLSESRSLKSLVSSYRGLEDKGLLEITDLWCSSILQTSYCILLICGEILSIHLVSSNSSASYSLCLFTTFLS
jgi:hypothetical protein